MLDQVKSATSNANIDNLMAAIDTVHLSVAFMIVMHAVSTLSENEFIADLCDRGVTVNPNSCEVGSL